jgi:hypothetical protein
MIDKHKKDKQLEAERAQHFIDALEHTSTVHAHNKGYKQLGVFLQVLNEAPGDMKVSDLILALNRGPRTIPEDNDEADKEEAPDAANDKGRRNSRSVPEDSDDEEVPVSKSELARRSKVCTLRYQDRSQARLSTGQDNQQRPEAPP